MFDFGNGLQASISSIAPLMTFVNEGGVPDKSSTFATSFTLRMRVSEERGAVAFLIGWIIAIPKNDGPEPARTVLVDIRVEVEFRLVGFDTVFRRKEGSEGHVVDREAILRLLMIAFSTARGVMAMQVRGSKYERMYLPIVSQEELVERLFEKQPNPTRSENSQELTSGNSHAQTSKTEEDLPLTKAKPKRRRKIERN